MGTSSSTLDVGKALRALLSNVPVNNESFTLLLGTSLSNSEIERAIPISVLRTMRHYYTKNFALLLFKCIETVANIKESCESPENIQDGAQKLQNSLRLMRRMLPVAFESGDTTYDEIEEDTDDKKDSIQNNNTSNSNGNQENNEAGIVLRAVEISKPRSKFTTNFVKYFFIDNLTCDDENSDQEFPRIKGQTSYLSKFLIRLLVDCCFIQGLTLNSNVLSSKTCINHLYVEESKLWYSGVGRKYSTTTTIPNKKINTIVHSVRNELLYTLLVVLSYPLFSPPESRDTIFTEPLLNIDDVPLLPTLVASTLNALISYIPFGSLPYTSHIVGSEELVILMSARFLSTLICYPGAPLNEEEALIQIPNTSESENVEKNNEKNLTETNENSKVLKNKTSNFPNLKVIHSAREFIRAITAEEAKEIVRGLKSIIGLKMYSNRTFLPDSQRCFLTQDEFMMILWRLIDLSPECLVAFGNEKEILEYILPLIDYAIDAKRDPQYFSHLQLVLFILLRLSEHRNFCLHCNTPFRERIPFEFDTFEGSYSDLIILMICTFLLIRHDMIRPFHITCSAIISNLAPFITNISVAVSEKLSLLFASVSIRCLSYQCSNSESSIIIDDAEVKSDQIVMLNIVEAIASMLGYHELGAAPLLVAFMSRKSLVNEIYNIFTAEDGKAFRVPRNSPFLIGTLKEAIAAVEETFIEAISTGKDPVAAIRKITLVGALPTPHRILVKRLYSTWQMEQWAMSTIWSSLYMYSPPGTFGDSKSIKMLRFA